MAEMPDLYFRLVADDCAPELGLHPGDRMSLGFTRYPSGKLVPNAFVVVRQVDLAAVKDALELGQLLLDDDDEARLPELEKLLADQLLAPPPPRRLRLQLVKGGRA